MQTRLVPIGLVLLIVGVIAALILTPAIPLILFMLLVPLVVVGIGLGATSRGAGDGPTHADTGPAEPAPRPPEEQPVSHESPVSR